MTSTGPAVAAGQAPAGDGTVPTDTTRRNEDLVRKQYEAVQNADIDAFFSRCSPDMVIHEASSMKVGGTYRGLAELGGLLRQLAGLYDMTTIEMDRIVANDEYVVAMGSFLTADHSYRVQITEWWQIENGKVVEVRPFYWDTQELNAALG